MSTEKIEGLVCKGISRVASYRNAIVERSLHSDVNGYTIQELLSLRCQGATGWIFLVNQAIRQIQILVSLFPSRLGIAHSSSYEGVKPPLPLPTYFKLLYIFFPIPPSSFHRCRYCFYARPIRPFSDHLLKLFSLGKVKQSGNPQANFSDLEMQTHTILNDISERFKIK